MSDTAHRLNKIAMRLGLPDPGLRGGYLLFTETVTDILEALELRTNPSGAAKYTNTHDAANH